jgi:hypothetical protein
MLAKLLKHWGLYVALLILLGPIVLIWTIEPDWVARVVEMGIFVTVLPLICLWYAIGPKKNLLDVGRRTNLWPNYVISRLGKNGVDNMTRILIFLVGLMFALILTIPFAKDVLLISKHKAPIERTAYVANTRSLLANISEEVILNTYPKAREEDHLTASYFTPHHIMTGNTYTFFILPHSHIILEAIPVEITKK